MLFSVSTRGVRRLVASAPGGLTITDLDKSGKRALVTAGSGWWSVQTGGAVRAAETTLDLFGRLSLVGLSADGRWALLHEFPRAGQGTYLCSTDGKKTVRLTDDPPLALSPDAAWVLTRRDSDRAHLFLVPSGSGAPQTLPLAAPLQPAGGAQWSGDGRQLFLALAPEAKDSERRIYRFDAPGDWRPVTPTGVQPRFAVSPDGRAIAVRDRDGRLTIFSTVGAEPRPVADEKGSPIRWSADSRWLFLESQDAYRAHLYRRELASGRVEPWRDLGPADPTGVLSLGDPTFLSADGASYAYAYNRAATVLYLVDGLE